ncbi:acyl-CoA desaturase [Rhodocytophaga rosea]|uniref:Acyl-CoA desaturase n=1 Tax=Rhodocytophaga rosea TaxID=2704465 RepID=A0A6C0GMB8_9BACT|nr:acyl-CoA desaturase [Rhodocytophaga rosea]QHT68752.1 acyl-CoA desaturase [Rhodocytophaga rosea]
MTQKIRFVDTGKSEFFATVRKRVDAYFKENNISKNANAAMWAKTTFFLGGLVIIYALIISNQFSPLVMLGLAVLLGMFAAFIGFNVCHDAIHGSFSANPKVNKVLSLVFNVIGANAYVWSITHNVVHHTYTNIPGHDEDIEVAPGLIRLSPDEKVTWMQQYQHLYAFLLYGLASLSWVFRKDFKKFYQKRIGQYDNSTHPKGEVFNLFFFKGVYYVLFLIIPLIVLDITWWQFLIGFVAMHLAEGLVLGLVFQLAHVVEGTEFPSPDEEGNIEEAWAVVQMRTTANFARKSWLANFLCGGLNFQIEHHLFPRICHIHYRPVSEIVKKTAEEFGLPYIESETFGGAIASHYKMLRKFGKEAYQESILSRKNAAMVANLNV